MKSLLLLLVGLTLVVCPRDAVAARNRSQMPPRADPRSNAGFKAEPAADATVASPSDSSGGSTNRTSSATDTTSKSDADRGSADTTSGAATSSSTAAGTGSTAAPTTTGGRWTLLAWNNLGMHCMDDDYAVFSILPPFNTVDVQLLDGAGKLVKSPSGLSVTFEAIADPSGSINRTSLGKTNFWDTASRLYGAGLTVPDVGLTGTRMPGPTNDLQPVPWGGSAALNWFEATGVPLTPTDDAMMRNAYPLMRFKAHDLKGNVLGQADVVLPVSDEMDCRACHASGSGVAAKPAAGWENDPNGKHDFRFNILRLHDEQQGGTSKFQQALAAVGYNAAGLHATAKGGQPILCASCHKSEALPNTGIAGVPPLTTAMHSLHAAVTSPKTGLKLNAMMNRSACYECHPGSTTQCLRGAMGAAVDPGTGTLAMQCQSCHGSMSDVGAATRTGWLNEPNCQACHTGTATQNSGQIRYTSAFSSAGVLRTPANPTFATNPNTPAAGISLYRFSSGHGGLQCSACHGSTHAEWPSVHANDNVLAQKLQGHGGVLIECAACHTTAPQTTSGGPHGMHPIGNAWLDQHGDVAEHNSARCAACHGSTYKGSVLSRAHAARSLTHENRTANFWSGQTISCYECHNGPKGEGQAPAAPVVGTTTTLMVSSGSTSASKAIASSPSTGVTLRVVNAPVHGTAAVQGTTVTYYPFAGYSGPDTLSYAVSNGTRESNLGQLTIMVQ